MRVVFARTALMEPMTMPIAPKTNSTSHTPRETMTSRPNTRMYTFTSRKMYPLETMLERMAEAVGVELEYAPGSQVSNGKSALFIDRPTVMSAAAIVSGMRYSPLAASAAMLSCRFTISRWPVTV